MYDYVVVLLTDSIGEEQVFSCRKVLEEFGIKCTEKLPPHITIDLYKNINQALLLEIVASLVKQIKSFSFEVEEINHFNNNVYFFRPNHLEQFKMIKRRFDEALSLYAIKDNENKGIYHPHITIVSGNNIVFPTIVEQSFIPFQSEITDLCVYNNQKQLIKKYPLNGR